MKHIVAMVGTNSDQSTNRDLIYFMKDLFKDRAHLEVLEIKDLPLYNKPEDKTVPYEVQAMADKISKADGVIISTPEYDHSVTASLLNALSWCSYGTYPFVDKPVMITGASYGTLGSSRALSHLRQVLNAPELKAHVLPSSEFLLSHSLNAFDDQGKLKDAEQVDHLNKIFNDFIIYIDVNAQLVNAHGSNLKQAQNFSWEEGEQ